jgi:DHA1 family bicyclomycin/chloramphenicol resistance-like MFS transporter
VSDAGEQRSGVTVPVLIVLGIATAVSTFSMSVTIPSLPQVALELHTRNSNVQLTLTACVIGIALGQLFSGPLSDAKGRRGPLLFGVVAWTALSFACAAAPSIGVLIGLRFAQGFFGSFGLTIARAMIRDTSEGHALYRNFARLALVTGVAPIIAPTVGGLLLLVTGWRGIFAVLAVIGVGLAIASLLLLTETHLRPARTSPRVRDVWAGYRIVLSESTFLRPALVGGLGYAAVFTYVSNAAFLFHDRYGVSGTEFGFIFGANGLGFAVVAQIVVHIARHRSERVILRTAISAALLGCGGIIGFSRLDVEGPWLVVSSLFVMVVSLGGVIPLASSMAMKSMPSRAGSASGMLGLLQFATGAVVAPIVSQLGVTGTTLGLTLAASLVLAFAVVPARAGIVGGESAGGNSAQAAQLRGAG